MFNAGLMGVCGRAAGVGPILRILMKRWLVCLLLAVFCIHTFPLLQLGKDACALLAEDAPDAEEDGGEEPVQPVKKEAAPKWYAPPATQGFTRLHFSRKVDVALHDAAIPGPPFAGEVLTPPPNGCQAIRTA